MNAIQREIDSTYGRTLSLIVDVKRKAYRRGFLEGIAVAIAVRVLWWAITTT